jgi:FixJ family two-component response regulator
MVEDEEPQIRVLTRLLKTRFQIESARTIAQANALISTPPPFAGVILDITLPDGSGIDLLAELRGKGLAAPVLILSGYFEKPLVARAQFLGAEYLPKPPDAGHMLAFAQRVSAFARSNDPRAQKFIETFARVHKLTGRQTEIVALAAANIPREEMLIRMGVGHETLKTQIRAVLRKSRDRTLAALIARLYKEMRADGE